MVTWYIVPYLTTPIILGMTFLQDINPKLDWVAKTIKWSDISGKVMLTAILWHQHRQVEMVSLESLLQSVWVSYWLLAS